jgi:hypothetical protein
LAPAGWKFLKNFVNYVDTYCIELSKTNWPASISTNKLLRLKIGNQILDSSSTLTFWNRDTFKFRTILLSVIKWSSSTLFLVRFSNGDCIQMVLINLDVEWSSNRQFNFWTRFRL